MESFSAGKKRMLAVIRPTKKELTFAFAPGAAIKDKFGLLRGAGKASKHVKNKDLKEVHKAALKS